MTIDNVLPGWLAQGELMRMAPSIVGWVSVGVMALGAGMTFAQDYPNKVIRIVTGGVGGANDIVARSVAQGLSGAWGQPVVVDNRPSGIIPAEIVSKAPADGYTLIVIGISFWTSPLLRTVSYDPVQDFSPITMAIRSPSILVIHPSLPVKSVKELIALARAKPGVLAYASTGVGGPQHIGAELFKSMARIDIVHVPYKGTAASIADLMSGQVQMAFGSALPVAPHLASGRLRALAVASAQPSALAPGVPTVAASGLPGYELTSPQAIFAPARTPQMIISRLNQEIVRLLNRPDTKEKFLSAGIEVVGSTPDELAASVKSDIVKLGKLIKDAGIKVE